MPTLLYATPDGPVVVKDNKALKVDREWDQLFNTPDLAGVLANHDGPETPLPETLPQAPPLGRQEIWAAGVTYYRSRDARMAESKEAGGGSFYDKVYAAERPELFYKGSLRNTVGNGGLVRIREDSKWNVPEPELALAVDNAGEIIGYCVGNDMSSRDIEGANPLYLPQAKVFDGSCGLGPAILVRSDPLGPETEIGLSIDRDGATIFAGATSLAELKRTPQELVSYLYRDNTFPAGCFLLTGTGIVPPDGFTLASGDRIAISITGIGTLTNQVA